MKQYLTVSNEHSICLNPLARAIDKFHSSFTSFILISSGLSYDHCHSILSPFSMSKRFTSAAGTDVIKLFEPWSLTFVKKFISFIVSSLYFLSYKSIIITILLTDIKTDKNKNIYISGYINNKIGFRKRKLEKMAVFSNDCNKNQKRKAREKYEK